MEATDIVIRIVLINHIFLFKKKFTLKNVDFNPYVLKGENFVNIY